MGSESLRRSIARSATLSSRSGRAILQLVNAAMARGHREADPDGEERHQATLLVERFGHGSSPA